jgi:Fe-S-cluster containining protein
VQNDSVSKIVSRYFAVLTKQAFVYRNHTYTPKKVTVSPLLLRGYMCPSQCGGCCQGQFSLDYLPCEDKPAGVAPRVIDFNGREVIVYSDLQGDHDLHHCRHLRQADGRCDIYPVRPFSCDFELIRTLEYADADHANVLTQKLYGRGWNMLRVGALCEMTPATPETVKEVIRKLNRLQDWAGHFGIETWAGDIIGLIQNSRLAKGPVTLDPNSCKCARFGLGGAEA